MGSRRTLINLWRGQEGRCFFCDGETVFWSLAFRDGRAQPCVNVGLTHPAHAQLTTLARECDGGDRSFINLVMSCRFCVLARAHAFARDHAAEMEALIRYGLHPLHPNGAMEAAA
jgi:hypothetical protein